MTHSHSSSGGHSDPLHILHQLNSDFERSKKEQIDRFLRDQDELNKRFGDFALNNDQENGSGGRKDDTDFDDNDSDDVESEFNLRLDTFRVRPLSARLGGWPEGLKGRSATGGLAGEEIVPKPKKPTEVTATRCRRPDRSGGGVDGAVGSGGGDLYGKFARNRDRSTSRESRSRVKLSTLSRNKSKERSVRKPVPAAAAEQVATVPVSKGTDEEAPAAKKLLVRRRHRPRTAMGLQQTSRGETTDEHGRQVDEMTTMAGAGTEPGELKGVGVRAMRASAPAASRVMRKVSWESEEMRRSTYMERQTVRGGPSSLGASVTALHNKTRQQELLQASFSATNLAGATSAGGLGGDAVTQLRQSRTFGSTHHKETPVTTAAAPATLSGTSWANISTPRLATNRDPLVATPRRESDSPQQRDDSHRYRSHKDGSRTSSKLSLLKLPRLDGNTLPKPALHQNEPTLLANTSN